MKSDYKPGEEVRITSPTGGQKGQKSARLGGADPLALQELGLVYGMGEQKYDRYNYLKGYAWSLSVDALLRHLLAFLAGEDRDEESGLLHTAHVAWHALTLTSFQLRSVGTDDRAPELQSTGSPSCDHGVLLSSMCGVCAYEPTIGAAARAWQRVYDSTPEYTSITTHRIGQPTETVTV